MKKLSPIVIIVLSFMIVIVIGTLLLKLPFSVNSGCELAWVDSLFLSTSAICVTGLSSIANIGATLSVFGKIVLAFLIQIGGLGFVTIAVYILVIMGVKIGIQDRQIIKEALNQNSIRGLMKLVKRIIVIVFAVEFVGFIMYLFAFSNICDNFWDVVGNSAFHAVSAFNNCGFDLLGSTSFVAYRDNVLLNITVMMLVMLGGIGFVVIDDVLKKHFKVKKFSNHTVLVLKTSVILWVVGTILLKLTEGGEISWMQAAFQSVCARTAGFATMDMSKLSSSGAVLLMVLMFFGAAPCSTGGGIKVTAVYALFRSVMSYSSGNRPMVRGRSISTRSVYKAFVLVVLALSIIMFNVFLLSLIEKDTEYLPLMFEVVSAFGTVGFSMGVTPTLLPLSKLLLVPVMFIGRLGPLTLIALLNTRKSSGSRIKYIEENLIIG